MSTTVVDLNQRHAAQIPFHAESVQRTAFYFESQGQPVFAWLHHRVERTGFDHGVLICPPIGYEQLHSHRALRHLADQLAQEEAPVLRFDWQGTGDSSGAHEDAGRVAMWVNNIRDAVRWMREQLGCRQISLVGLRLDGSLAAVATTELEIDNLVLWSPVTNGRAYVREMKAISLTAEVTSRSEPDVGGIIEASGFVLSTETAADLSQLDLLRCQPMCRRVLLVSRDDVQDDGRLSDCWLASGIGVENVSVPGYVEMMAEPHHSDVPRTAIREITSWLTRHISAEADTNFDIDSGGAAPREALMPASANHHHRGAEPSVRESAMQISVQPDLFGIACEPVDDARTNEQPLVVLLNAGSSYRIGPGRLNVCLARQLAAQGFRSFRLDFCGLGDSVTTETQCENVTYQATAFRDLELVLSELQRRCGARRIVLLGLCSGAYAAFQSAAQIQTPVLVECVLINPLTFFWREGMSLETSLTRQLVAMHYYIGAALEPRKWLKLFQGKCKIGMLGAIKIVLRKLGLLRLRTPVARANSCDEAPRVGLGHPLNDDLSSDLHRVVNLRRNLAMFFSTTERVLQIGVQRCCAGQHSFLLTTMYIAVERRRLSRVHAERRGGHHVFSSEVARNGRRQLRPVVLHRQDVLPASLDDGLAHVLMTEGHVRRDHTPREH